MESYAFPVADEIALPSGMQIDAVLQNILEGTLDAEHGPLYRFR